MTLFPTMKRLAIFFFLLSLSLSLRAEEHQAVAILLDNSKSVPAADFEKAKGIVDQLVQNAQGPVSVYVFGTQMKKIDSSDLVSIQPTDSNTMIYDSAYDAAQEVAKIQADHKALIVISDGIDTKSATILEDIVGFANSEGIAIYGIGVGKPNVKNLERMARLTGGKFLTIDSPEIMQTLQSSLANQKTVPKTEERKTVVVQQPVPAPPASQPAVTAPSVKEEESSFSYKWILILVLSAVVLMGVLWIIVRAYRTPERNCPTCGRTLEPYQTICQVCSVAETRQTQAVQFQPTTTQEMPVDDYPLPPTLLEKKPVSEEMLSKTFVLMETPMLVVRKGKNLGQMYSLNRGFPISIGRSRVNEIRLDDVTVSGQHCRVIPENGRHVLCDLNSTNGTFLNDKKVNRQTLTEGDTIRVGETQFLYKVEQSRTS